MRLRKRISYAAAALALIAVEVIIALFVHDRFVRPYIGDVLVIAVIWALARVVLPEGVRLMPLYIFIFAAGVEVLQYFDIVRLLGLEGSRFFSILIGLTFDIRDIVCYAVGCVLITVIEVFIRGREAAPDNTGVK